MTNQTVPPCPKCGKPPKCDNDIALECCGVRCDNYIEWLSYIRDRLYDALAERGIYTIQHLTERLAPDPRVAELSGYITVLLDLATDAANGLEYVRDVHGDLYGVGFDRVKIKAEVLPVIRLKMTQLIAAQRGEVEG